jgi:hypothetical protein
MVIIAMDEISEVTRTVKIIAQMTASHDKAQQTIEG